MDKILHKVLQDQQGRLVNLQKDVGRPQYTDKEAFDLNYSVYLLKHYCHFLEGLDFKSFEAVEEWL